MNFLNRIEKAKEMLKYYNEYKTPYTYLEMLEYLATTDDEGGECVEGHNITVHHSLFNDNEGSK